MVKKQMGQMLTEYMQIKSEKEKDVACSLVVQSTLREFQIAKRLL